MKKMPQKRSANKSALSLFRSQLRWLLRYGPACIFMEEWDDTWDEGLCGVLADGLFQWIAHSPEVSSGAVSLLLVGDTNCPAQHVVVCVQAKSVDEAVKRWCLDSDGVSSEAVLLRIWRDVEGLKDPFLANYDEELLLKYNIPHDQEKSARLAECFFSVFGSFSPAFLAE